MSDGGSLSPCDTSTRRSVYLGNVALDLNLFLNRCWDRLAQLTHRYFMTRTDVVLFFLSFQDCILLMRLLLVGCHHGHPIELVWLVLLLGGVDDHRATAGYETTLSCGYLAVIVTWFDLLSDGARL